MNAFLSKEAIYTLWHEKLLQLAPRLAGENGSHQKLIEGDLKLDLGLDSLEIFELAAYFHSVFHLMSGPLSQYLLQYQRVEEWLEVIEEGANDWTRPMTFFTSGSTGNPKPFVHQKKYLIQEMEAWNTILKPQGFFWRAVSPLHIYGFLFTVLLPSHIGIGVMDMRKVHTHQVFSLVKPSDWIIGFPLLYRQWIHSDVRIPLGLKLLSSTSPLPFEVASQMHAYGLEVTEIYGSTETAGIGYRAHPENSFHLLPYWQRKEDQLVRYHPTQGASAPFALMDKCKWETNHRFTILGRRDHAVQVGGINVFPNQVAEQIRGIQGVANCWVKKMKPSEGERLKCWVLLADPKASASSLKKICYQWIEEHLSAEARPRHVIVSDHPPLDEMGKVKDWSIYHSAPFLA
ncbi:MAG: AMP-binding protein [Bacteroidota bacterium]